MGAKAVGTVAAACGLAMVLLAGCGGGPSMPPAMPLPSAAPMPAPALPPAAPSAQPAASAASDELPDGVERNYSLVRGARVFTCNYYTDLDGNDTPDRGEFAGVKSRFRKTERILIVTELPAPAGPGLEMRTKVWGPRGKMILDTTAPVSAQRKFYRMGDEQPGGAEYDLMAFLTSKGGLGTYRVACFVKGLFLCTCDFEIVE